MRAGLVFIALVPLLSWKHPMLRTFKVLSPTGDIEMDGMSLCSRGPKSRGGGQIGNRESHVSDISEVLKSVHRQKLYRVKTP